MSSDVQEKVEVKGHSLSQHLKPQKTTAIILDERDSYIFSCAGVVVAMATD